MNVYYHNEKLENGKCIIPVKYNKIKYIRITLYDFVLEDDDILNIRNTDEYNINKLLQTYCKKTICNINPYLYDEMNMDLCKKNNKEILISYSTHLNEINTGYYKPTNDYLEFEFCTKTNDSSVIIKDNAKGDILVRICYEL